MNLSFLSFKFLDFPLPSSTSMDSLILYPMIIQSQRLVNKFDDLMGEINYGRNSQLYQSQQQMSTKSDIFGLKTKTYVGLQKIRQQCRQNSKPTTAPTSYKPLLLNFTDNYHRRNLKPHQKSFQKDKYKSKTARSYQKCISSSQKGPYTSPHAFFNPNKTHIKIDSSSHFFMTNNFLQESSPIITIEDFLEKLYVAKTKDLKIYANARQKKMFIQRLKDQVTQQKLVAPQSDLGPHSIAQISRFCAKFENIKILNLDRNPIGDSGTIKLSKLLPKLVVQQFSMTSANMSSRGGTKILESMIGHETLKSVNISSPDSFNRNKIGNQSLSKLAQLLSHPNCIIENLQLANVGMGESGFLSFCTGIKKSQQCHLKVLNLSSNEIKVHEDNARYVKVCLEKLPAFKIQMQNNQLGDVGAQIFGYILGTLYGKSEISINLEYLDLSSNSIRSIGSNHICSALMNNKKISDLLLSGNKLGDGDCFYKFKSFLCANWTIKKLVMRNCLGSSSNLKFIAEGLIKNRSLYHLDISQNNLQADDFYALFQSIENNSFLQILKVSNCNISDLYITKVEPFLNNKCPIRELCLANNFITDVGARKILKALMERHRIICLNLKKNCINLHMLDEIAYYLKDNKIMFKNRDEDPELQYYLKAVARQEQKKQALNNTIQQLQQKSMRLKMKSKVQSLCSQQVLLWEKKNLYDIEQQCVKQLEDQIKTKMNSPRAPKQDKEEDQKLEGQQFGQ